MQEFKCSHSFFNKAIDSYAEYCLTKIHKTKQQFKELKSKIKKTRRFNSFLRIVECGAGHIRKLSVPQLGHGPRFSNHWIEPNQPITVFNTSSGGATVHVSQQIQLSVSFVSPARPIFTSGLYVNKH